MISASLSLPFDTVSVFHLGVAFSLASSSIGGLVRTSSLGIGAALTFAKLRGWPLVSMLRFVLGFNFLTFTFISTKAFQALQPCDCFDGDDETGVCYLMAD